MERILQEERQDWDITEDFHRLDAKAPRKPLDFKNRSVPCFTIFVALASHISKTNFNGLRDHAKCSVFHKK
jgi:hypothetical protein